MALKSGVADAFRRHTLDDRLAPWFSTPAAGHFQACRETTLRPGALVYMSPLSSRGTSAAFMDEPCNADGLDPPRLGTGA